MGRVACQPRRLAVLGALLMVAVVVQAAGVVTTGATFADPTATEANAFTAGILGPPTNTNATNRPGDNVRVTWTSTGSTYAEGYYVYRSETSGCCYALIGTEMPRTKTSHTDGSVSSGLTYYYIIRAFAQQWTSVPTPEVAITVD